MGQYVLPHETPAERMDIHLTDELADGIKCWFISDSQALEIFNFENATFLPLFGSLLQAAKKTVSQTLHFRK